jgi:hypothetical protein
MPRFEGALASSRPFITVVIEAAPGQVSTVPGVRVEGLALLDTGSETSGITKQAADRLSLLTNVTIPIATPIGVEDVPCYVIRMDVKFNMPSESRTIQQSLKVFEDQSDWQPQMTGYDVVALIDGLGTGAGVA